LATPPEKQRARTTARRVWVESAEPPQGGLRTVTTDELLDLAALLPLSVERVSFLERTVIDPRLDVEILGELAMFQQEILLGF